MSKEDTEFRRVAITLAGADQLSELLGNVFSQECDRIGAELTKEIEKNGIKHLENLDFWFFDSKFGFRNGRWQFLEGIVRNHDHDKQE